MHSATSAFVLISQRLVYCIFVVAQQERLRLKGEQKCKIVNCHHVCEHFYQSSIRFSLVMGDCSVFDLEEYALTLQRQYNPSYWLHVKLNLEYHKWIHCV